MVEQAHLPSDHPHEVLRLRALGIKLRELRECPLLLPRCEGIHKGKHVRLRCRVDQQSHVLGIDRAAGAGVGQQLAYFLVQTPRIAVAHLREQVGGVRHDAAAEPPGALPQPPHQARSLRERQLLDRRMLLECLAQRPAQKGGSGPATVGAVGSDGFGWKISRFCSGTVGKNAASASTARVAALLLRGRLADAPLPRRAGCVSRESRPSTRATRCGAKNGAVAAAARTSAKEASAASRVVLRSAMSGGIASAARRCASSSMENSSVPYRTTIMAIALSAPHRF